MCYMQSEADSNITFMHVHHMQQETDNITANGYRYKGPILGKLKKCEALKFADPDVVSNFVDAALLELLGEQTDDNTKKSGV